MPVESNDRAWRAHVPVLALVALAIAASALGLGQALAWRAALWPALGTSFGVLLAALAAAFALSLMALAIELKDLQRRPQPAGTTVAALRRGLIVDVATWLVLLIAVQPFQGLWLEFAVAIGAGAWSGWHLLARRSDASWVRNLERALAAACAAIVLLELGLRALALASPMPLLARGDDAPGRFVERFRCKPGELRFGFACNERGFYDESFARRAPGEVRIASIGDSFNVGAVPHALHYTSLCEERLGARVDNFGVAGIGPPEYHHLLLEEALPLDPSAVVVSLFVGNDLDYTEPGDELQHGTLRGWFDRERVLIAVVPRRLARLRAERERAGNALGDVARLGAPRSAPRPDADRESLHASFPWLADPLLEQPSLSPAAFLRLETSRALAICRGEPRSLRDACERLRRMKADCGATPFGVLILPDEFQVEDELWNAVSASVNAPLERDLAQRLLSERLTAEDIPFLDLLPILRSRPPLADGRRHLYHLADTHFNALGNASAGEALADFAERLLAR